jgi:hypothetical protein
MVETRNMITHSKRGGDWGRESAGETPTGATETDGTIDEMPALRAVAPPGKLAGVGVGFKFYV